MVFLVDNQFIKYSVRTDQLIRKGKYEAVYAGNFKENFDPKYFSDKLKRRTNALQNQYQKKVKTFQSIR